MPGSESSVPITGKFRRKPITTGKKSPKSTTKPYTSTHMPITGQPRRTTEIPPRKQDVPARAARGVERGSERAGGGGGGAAAARSVAAWRRRTLPLARLEEELERLLRADDQHDAREEEDLRAARAA